MSPGTNEVISYYLRAGDIAYRVKKFVKGLVKTGTRLIDIASKVEEYIRSLGGEPAFPLNISINDVAAHRTPLIDDEDTIPNDSVVKIDIGVHINGYIADTAITLVFNDKYREMAEVNREALYRALKSLQPGMRFRDLGGIIESYVRKFGFRIVKNLTGHSLGRYLIHAGDVIPNYRDPLVLGRFRVGNAYAIEPFLTDGRGYVCEVKSKVQIYALKPRHKDIATLTEDELELLEIIESKFKTLPFCERWLVKYVEVSKLRRLLRLLANKDYLIAYPVLVESGGGFVTQFEETIFVSKDQVFIITNPEIKQ